MLYRYEQLERQLAALSAATVPLLWLITGDEWVLQQHSIEQIHACAIKVGFESVQRLVIEKNTDWSDLLDSTQSMSLFAERERIEVKCWQDKLGVEAKQVLTRIVEQIQHAPNEDQLLIVWLPTPDKTLKALYTEWAKHSRIVWMAVPSLTVQQIPTWIEQQMQRQQQRISADALALMSTWVQGNLFAAQQALLKLSYLYPVGEDAPMIGESAIREVMSNSARYDVVDLEIAILQQNYTAALTITDVLQHEGVALPLVVWQCADLFETLLAIKAHNNQIDVTLQRRCRLWFDRQTRFQHGVQRYQIDTITTALQQLHYLERQVKGVPAQSLSVVRHADHLGSADGWQGLKAGLMRWLSFE